MFTHKMSIKSNDTNDNKAVIVSYLKYFFPLITIIITPVIVGMPDFEYWHLAPVWGGGGLTTIVVWQQTRDDISPEMKAILKQESMRRRYNFYGQLILVLFVVVFMGGMTGMFLIFINPEILDKIFEFVLELVK